MPSTAPELYPDISLAAVLYICHVALIVINTPHPPLFLKDSMSHPRCNHSNFSSCFLHLFSISLARWMQHAWLCCWWLSVTFLGISRYGGYSTAPGLCGDKPCHSCSWPSTQHTQWSGRRKYQLVSQALNTDSFCQGDILRLYLMLTQVCYSYRGNYIK